MTFRSSHFFFAGASGIKCVRVKILRRIAGTPALLVLHGNFFRRLRRTVMRFDAWRAQGLDS